MTRPRSRRVPASHRARTRTLAIVLAAPVAIFAVPAPAQAPDLMALAKIRPGLWEIRPRDNREAIQKICVRNAAQLLKLQHRGASCGKPYVIDNQSVTATVSYSCGASGHGRTTIRAENGDIIQLNTQGIAGNAPFSYSAEGRRRGSC